MTNQTAIARKFNVTDEQISKAHRIVLDSGETYYIVESQTVVDQEYEVHYHGKQHSKDVFSCTCAAGKQGSRCWHIRAACAHSRLWHIEQRAIAAYDARQARIQRLMSMGLTHEEACKAVSSNALINGQ